MPVITQRPPGSATPGLYVDRKLEKYNSHLGHKRGKILDLQRKVTLVMSSRAPRKILPWWVRLVLAFRFWG